MFTASRSRSPDWSEARSAVWRKPVALCVSSQQISLSRKPALHGALQQRLHAQQRSGVQQWFVVSGHRIVVSCVLQGNGRQVTVVCMPAAADFNVSIG